MDLNLNVVSGLTLSGKSWLLEQLLRLPEFRDAALVRMDDVRQQFWGDRAVTSIEGLLRNELTRMIIKAKLVIERPPVMFVELPLLTRKDHQVPLAEMARHAEWYIHEVEKERAEKEKREVGELPKVNLRVVMLYCGMRKAFKRIAQRQSEANTTNTIVFSEDQYLSIATRFEIPDPTTYTLLPVENISHLFNAETIEEVRAFFCGEKLGLHPNAIKIRLQNAQSYLDETKREAARRGLTKPLV